MPAIPKKEAIERIARAVETASFEDLSEVYAELYPENSVPEEIIAKDKASHIREEFEPEKVVDLWNVVFPIDCDVYMAAPKSQFEVN